MNDIEIIRNKIFTIRGQPVMLDRDFAQMYGVETRVLNQAVKRNLERFRKISCFSFQMMKWKIGNHKL